MNKYCYSVSNKIKWENEKSVYLAKNKPLHCTKVFWSICQQNVATKKKSMVSLSILSRQTHTMWSPEWLTTSLESSTTLERWLTTLTHTHTPVPFALWNSSFGKWGSCWMSRGIFAAKIFGRMLMFQPSCNPPFPPDSGGALSPSSSPSFTYKMRGIIAGRGEWKDKKQIGGEVRRQRLKRTLDKCYLESCDVQLQLKYCKYVYIHTVVNIIFITSFVLKCFSAPTRSAFAEKVRF